MSESAEQPTEAEVEVTDEMVEAAAAAMPRPFGMRGTFPREYDRDVARRILSAAVSPLREQVQKLTEENERLTAAAQAAVDEWRNNDDLWPDHRVRRLGEPMRLLSMRLRSAALDGSSSKGEQ